MLKTTIYVSLGLHKGRPSYSTDEAFSHQKRTSSTSKHEISSIFVGSFLLSWIQPDLKSGSTDLIESGSETLQFIHTVFLFSAVAVQERGAA
jgi:hypothetical protein